jgi:heptaprenyl diphosphate synthase
LTDDSEVEQALALLRAGSGLGRARKTLVEYADRARDVLRILPDHPARAALFTLADYLVDRTS